MLASGSYPEQLREVLESARGVAPDSAAVRVLQLRAAAQRRDDAAIRLLSHELDPLTNDPAIARGVGLALFERIDCSRDADPLTRELMSGDIRQALISRAFALLRRSEQELPLDLEAAWALGMLAATLGRETDFASRRLAQAANIAPENAWLMQAQARLQPK
jgi:hypothetical protein